MLKAHGVRLTSKDAHESPAAQCQPGRGTQLSVSPDVAHSSGKELGRAGKEGNKSPLFKACVAGRAKDPKEFTKD